MTNSDSDNDKNQETRKRRSRRPVKRRRKNRGSDKSGNKSGARAEQGEKSEKQRINEQARKERRRRKRRRRGSSSRRRTSERKEQPATLEIDYVAPESIFIYTHVTRKDARDSGYEFRPEHFAHVDRRLEDFRIDLSPIMGTILEVEEGSKGILHEFVWDDELDEETVFVQEEDEGNAAQE